MKTFPSTYEQVPQTLFFCLLIRRENDIKSNFAAF